jgi:hypothetical protein
MKGHWEDVDEDEEVDGIVCVRGNARVGGLFRSAIVTKVVKSRAVQWCTNELNALLRSIEH